MPFEPVPLDEIVFTALRATLLRIVPSSWQVVQGQDDRVAEPKPPFIVMIPIGRVRLATNVDTWDMRPSPAPAPTTIDIMASTQVRMQLDLHGSDAADVAQVISTLLRDYWGVDNMDSGVVPLYCDDPKQAPFLNAERQYENRWIVQVLLQVNPVIVTPQQFADIVTVTAANREAT